MIYLQEDRKSFAFLMMYNTRTLQNAIIIHKGDVIAIKFVALHKI